MKKILFLFLLLNSTIVSSTSLDALLDTARYYDYDNFEDFCTSTVTDYKNNVRNNMYLLDYIDQNPDSVSNEIKSELIVFAARNVRYLKDILSNCPRVPEDGNGSTWDPAYTVTYAKLLEIYEDIEADFQ